MNVSRSAGHTSASSERAGVGGMLVKGLEWLDKLNLRSSPGATLLSVGHSSPLDPREIGVRRRGPLRGSPLRHLDASPRESGATSNGMVSPSGEAFEGRDLGSALLQAVGGRRSLEAMPATVFRPGSVAPRQGPSFPSEVAELSILAGRDMQCKRQAVLFIPQRKTPPAVLNGAPKASRSLRRRISRRILRECPLLLRRAPKALLSGSLVIN